MDVEWIRKYCMGLAHTTETVQWGNDLVFKIGGKMYAVTPLGTRARLPLVQVLSGRFRRPPRARGYHPGAVHGARAVGGAAA